MLITLSIPSPNQMRTKRKEDAYRKGRKQSEKKGCSQLVAGNGERHHTACCRLGRKLRRCCFAGTRLLAEDEGRPDCSSWYTPEKTRLPEHSKLTKEMLPEGALLGNPAVDEEKEPRRRNGKIGRDEAECGWLCERCCG